MKKRLLALCLAAALLVSLAPALNLATGASAEAISHADKILTPGTGDIIAANTGHANTTDGLNSGNPYTPAGTDYYWYARTSTSASLTTWGKFATETNNLALDHSKDITFMFQIQFNEFHDIGEQKKLYTTDTGAKGISGIWYFLLNDSDAENGGFVYPFVYQGNDTENDTKYIQFLMPTGTYGNDVYSDPIELGDLAGRTRLQLVWKANGAVDVYVATSTFVTNVSPYEFRFGNFEYKGTVLGATWTRNTEAAVGTIDNPKSVGANNAANVVGSETDFFESGIAYAGSSSTYIWDVQITHTEPITDAAAYLTGEDIVIDNALNELSWRYAPWNEFVGGVEGEAAVLMKNGEAYVALKSATATSATVTLGDSTKENVTFVNGVAEIKFEDASIDSLYEKLAYSVVVTDGSKTGIVEYTQVVLNSKKVNTALKGDGHYVETRWSADQTEVKEGAIYRNGIDFTSSDASLMNYQRIGAGKFFAFTGTHNAKWNHQNDIYAEFNLFTNDLPVTTNDGKFDAAADAYEGFSFHVLDRENNALFTANIYNADAEGNLKARILKSDNTDSDPIDLGIKVDDENGAAKFGFLWTKEGAVVVLVNGEIKGTVENGTHALSATPTWTWTNPDSADRMLAKLGTASGHMYIYEFAVHEVSLDPNEVVTQQVVIGDDLNFNFATNVGNGTASATVNGQAVEADAEGNISIDLAAAQMNDVVELTITDDSGMTVTKEYTVRDYALTILNDETGAYDEAKPLVEAMLHYGAAAQTYFEHNDDALVTDGLNLTAPTVAPVAGAAANITDGGLSDLGIKYYGASLLFKNKTTLRFYFEVEGDISAAAFYIGGPNGTPVTPKQSGESNFYYIDIVDICPQDLDNQVTIFAADVEFGGVLSASVTYSPANYMVNIYNSANSSAALKQLMVAMYNYNLAANAYVA